MVFIGILMLALVSAELDEPAVVAAARACQESPSDPQWKYLVSQGPGVFPIVSQVWRAESDLSRLKKLATDIALAALKESTRAEPDLRYHGQFDGLKPLGVLGAEAVLELFRSDDVPVRYRTRAATALGDLGHPGVIPALDQLVGDFLTETWCVREAGFTMARLGQRRHVETWLAAGKAVVDTEVTAANLTAVLAAHSDLAEIHYRIEEYAMAVSHYQQKMALLRGFRDRIPPEMRRPVDQEIALLHYNLACSLSLAGRLDDAMRALEKSLESVGVTLAMIEHDGDLRAVRARPGFSEWLGKVKAGRTPAAPKDSGPPVITPPGEDGGSTSSPGPSKL